MYEKILLQNLSKLEESLESNKHKHTIESCNLNKNDNTNPINNKYNTIEKNLAVLNKSNNKLNEENS